MKIINPQILHFRESEGHLPPISAQKTVAAPPVGATEKPGKSCILL